MRKGWITLLLCCNACSTTEKQVATTQPAIPACVEQMIEKYKKAKKENPPKRVYSYRYNDRSVYYVSAGCCDQTSYLYDSACNLIGRPDGGFTGMGDGTLLDFNKVKTDQKLLWVDTR